jgi:hypothetical protein
MKKNIFKWTGAAVGTVAALACVNQASAQSSDAIIDKLVEKGIITQDEAKQLRDEADKGFRASYQAKSGLPDWVTALKLNGDFRGRYDALHGWDSDMMDRNRFRYRARLGVTALMWDNFEAGIRLTSSDPVGSFGGDPISGNTTFQDNGSKKFVYLDLAYGKWTPVNTYSFRDTVGIGKFENPLTFSEMVFDGDYTPEGALNQFTYTINDFQSLKFNTAVAVLDEISSSSHDPLFLGMQLQWDAIWMQKEGRKVIETSLGAGFLGVKNPENLGNGDVPNQNVGNTRDATTGDLVYNYNPIVANASITYTLESFPMFSGFFPIKLSGEYMHNPAAPSQNSGWWAGMTLGKSGKRRTWELAYKYKYLEGDAWYEEFVDSDFGAYYGATPGLAGNTTAGWGKEAKSGYGAGTNAKGHIVKASYSPYDPFTVSVSYTLSDLVKNEASQYGTSDSIGRMIVDAVLKF